MLIDFIGENINGSTFASGHDFCGLLEDKDYEIGIRQILLEIKLTNRSMNQEDQFCLLNTDLVDRNSSNPNRAVSYFTLEAYKERHFYDFPTVDYFPLERTNTRPRFGIRDTFGNKNIRIVNIIVRAEIRPKCSDSANLSRC